MAESKKHRLSRVGGLACLFFAGFLIGKSGTVSGVSEPLSGEKEKMEKVSVPAPAEPQLSDELVRQMRIKDQAEFDQGVSFPGTKLTIIAFERSWGISDELARILALSPKERQSAQEAIDRSRQAFEDLAKNHTQYSRPEGASLAVKIRPYMQDGHAQLEILRTDLGRILPQEVAEELFRYFRFRATFGAFGANEVEIEFSNPAETPDSKAVHFIRKHSMTGTILWDFRCTEAELEDRAGFTRGMFE